MKTVQLEDLVEGPHNIYTKLVAVRAEYGSIVKTGEPKDGPQFKFVEASQISGKFVDLLSKYGLTMLPETMEIVDTRETTSKKETVHTILTTWRITDSESGETLTVQSFGQGSDSRDKSLPKAQTNAMKYAILLVLQKAGDDAERDAGPVEAPVAALPVGFAEWMGQINKMAELPSQVGQVVAPDGTWLREPLSTSPADALRAQPPADWPGRQENLAPEQVAYEATLTAEAEGRPSLALASTAKKNLIRVRGREVGLSDYQLKALTVSVTGKESSRQWTDGDGDKLLAFLEQEGAVALFREFKEEAPKEAVTA